MSVPVRRPSVAALRTQAHHIFLPYFGSADDRVALRFVLRLAADARVSLAVVHFKAAASLVQSFNVGRTSAGGNGKLPATTITTTTDDEEPSGTPLEERHAAFLASLRASLPASIAARVAVETVEWSPSSSSAMRDMVVARALAEVGRDPNNAGDLVVVGRNAGAAAAAAVSAASLSSALVCLGEAGEALTGAGVEASLLVVQAGRG